ncbi:MAG: NAD(P)H-hydrate dehydratase [Planctomycetota bacterium]|nr:NAD(P)H-hydrate dehydratase [Planctomycetota bacterium]
MATRVTLINRPPPLPRRAPDANKGDCGKVLVVGGSRGMSGAPCLAARGAYRGGAGLVKVAVPESIWDLAAGSFEEITTAGLPETREGALGRKAVKPALDLAEWADVVVMGMGMGRDDETIDFLRRVLEELKKPIVLDADGLYAFGGRQLTFLAKTQENHKERPLVLTPHPGEMGRLWDVSTVDVQDDRRMAAETLARAVHCVAVLKGKDTLVADVTRTYCNATGNPGMATGGTGDVLAGLIGALLGQNMPAFEAACLGVHLHGLAGDLAAKRLGPWSMMARDLADDLGLAFRKHAGRR